MGNQPSKDSIDLNNNNQRRTRPLNTAAYYQKYSQTNINANKVNSKMVVRPVKHRLVLTDKKSPLVALTSIGPNTSVHPEGRQQQHRPLPLHYDHHQRSSFNRRNSNKSAASSQNSSGSHNGSSTKKKKPLPPLHKQYGDLSQDGEGNFMNELIIDTCQQPIVRKKGRPIPNNHRDKDPQLISNINISNDVNGSGDGTQEHDRRDYWVYEYGAEKERDRQTRQHYVLKQIFGGNIHVELDQPERILESACGVGLWSLEMAQLYPHCQVTGIDVVPPSDKGGWQLSSLAITASNSGTNRGGSSSAGQKTSAAVTATNAAVTVMEKNITFQYCDVLQPNLPFPNDYFNFVYQRDVATVVPFDLWSQLISEFYRVLKPGGQIQLVEYDLMFRSPGPILTQVNDWYREVAVSIGVNPEYSDHLTAYLDAAGFTDVKTKVFDIPIGEWPSTLQEKQYGYLYKEQMKALFKSMKKWWCTKIDVSLEEYDRVCLEALEEFEQYHGEARWKIFTARKPGEEVV